VLMVLNIVVWDKSDLFILKLTNPGIAGNLQVTFFSIAFSLTDRMLMAPSAFSGGVKATMMAQVGREGERVVETTVTGARYAFLVAVPLLAGMAAVSRPFVLAAYQAAYRPMIPVLMITALMAVSKALGLAPTSLFQAVERQSYLIRVGCLCGAIDIGLDFLLTPKHGAIGAACANGIAQTLAALLLWAKLDRDFRPNLRLGAVARIAVSGAAMAAAAFAASLLPFSNYATLAASIAAGGVAWFLALRFTRALDRSDAERLWRLGEQLPAAAQPVFASCVRLLIAV
jgi:O-antigen/teichoic acid export membrane protein